MNSNGTPVEEKLIKGVWKNKGIKEADTQLPDFLSKRTE